MKITIEKIDDNVKVTNATEMTFKDSLELFLNGIVTNLEAIVERSVEQGADEQETRSQLHDIAVVAFSSAMLIFDPKSKDYKTAAEEDL